MPTGVCARCRTAVYDSAQLDLVKITCVDCATLGGGSGYRGSLEGSAGRSCRWESAPGERARWAGSAGGTGWTALISDLDWSALVCAGSGSVSAGFGAVPGGLCLSSGSPPYRNQGSTGFCRAGSEGLRGSSPAVIAGPSSSAAVSVRASRWRSAVSGIGNPVCAGRHHLTGEEVGAFLARAGRLGHDPVRLLAAR
jgi:hypothetical protein